MSLVLADVKVLPVIQQFFNHPFLLGQGLQGGLVFFVANFAENVEVLLALEVLNLLVEFHVAQFERLESENGKEVDCNIHILVLFVVQRLNSIQNGQGWLQYPKLDKSTILVVFQGQVGQVYPEHLN